MVSWEGEAGLRSALESGGRYLWRNQRPDGGFGWPEVDWSDAWTTAECVLGMAVSGVDDGVDRGLKWLRSHIHDDGGWSSEAYRNVTGGASDVAATAYAMRALSCCGHGSDRPLIEAGRRWLVEHQRSDGSWGIAAADESRGHVGQTGYAVSALARAPAEHRAAEVLQSALYSLYEMQRLAGGWELAPGHEMEPTLTAYALRGILDAAVLRGHRAQPRTFLRWQSNMQHLQAADGSWPDWYGNAASVEATGYAVELAACLGIATLANGTYASWIKRALDFLSATRHSSGGWGMAPGEVESPWVTHSVLICLAALLNDAPSVAARLEILSPGSDLPRIVDSGPSNAYDFAISFASTERDYARALALKIQQRGATVFFDSFETESLWGANLVDRFTQLYGEDAQLCIMIVSKEYVRRAWPRLERQSAQARSLASNREYILPIRFHRDVKVPGLLETVGYLDADQHDLDTIAALAMGKLQNLQN
ncbi:MAG TPA: prenyltransferase/squalene oxidase repeat-containing protein [Anaerolineae bacterium]|nr:prenyltransferase/squalene oxidase repeat-containing protein [Anaerolineae bacterium]